MPVACPACNFTGNVKSEYPPEKDFKLNCPKCKETFMVKVNHRQFYRVKLNRPASYSVDDIVDPFAINAKSGKILDISRTGIRIEGRMRNYSKKDEKEGNIMTLLFNLPPNKSMLKVKGEVKRLIIIDDNSFTMGIAFINLDVQTDLAIGTFLMP
ncbi:Type IV pilus assembly PilZ domain protein [Candidatus Magnetobacterium bavaricum]|uniref:Type IV pilus assembly PilZ domain protein n=1 Tax=Candidatus Magnetobacterium bavaricum TaxID=29290 RepID=A0A0F3GYI2_9BACT|nr:Type IV pilus assembly PilZ domain protein [Candidatus Magnetobacterium bavaricum]